MAAGTLPGGATAWLLIDVDGVLNVTASNRQAKLAGLARVRVNSTISGWTYTMQLHRWVGAAVSAAPVLAPAWCTSWGRDVDGPAHPAPISTMAGFARGLPVVDLGYYNDDSAASKVDGIIEFTDGTPFVWIDDDPADGDLARLAGLGQPNLFLHTNDTVGVTEEHIETAAAWAAALPR